MPLPEGVWEWPLLAGLLLVVGWVLWTQREEGRRMEAERTRYEERVGRILEAAERDRQRQIEAWDGLVARSIETQAAVAEGLGRLCLEVDRLTRCMAEEHEEMLSRCVEGHGKARARARAWSELADRLSFGEVGDGEGE